MGLNYKPIYECTIPTVEVLKKCFCGGYNKVVFMSRLVKEVFCSIGSSREGRGTGFLELLTALLAEIKPTTTTAATSTTTTTTTTTTTSAPAEKRRRKK